MSKIIISEFADCEEEVAFIRDYVANANNEIETLKAKLSKGQESFELALDNNIELKALHIDDLHDLDREINEKDKSIQLLAGKLKDAADDLEEFNSQGQQSTNNEYRDFANQFIDGE